MLDFAGAAKEGRDTRGCSYSSASDGCDALAVMPESVTDIYCQIAACRHVLTLALFPCCPSNVYSCNSISSYPQASNQNEHCERFRLQPKQACNAATTNHWRAGALPLARYLIMSQLDK